MTFLGLFLASRRAMKSGNAFIRYATIAGMKSMARSLRLPYLVRLGLPLTDVPESLIWGVSPANAANLFDVGKSALER